MFTRRMFMGQNARLGYLVTAIATVGLVCIIFIIKYQIGRAAFNSNILLLDVCSARGCTSSIHIVHPDRYSWCEDRECYFSVDCSSTMLNPLIADECNYDDCPRERVDNSDYCKVCKYSIKVYYSST